MSMCTLCRNLLNVRVGRYVLSPLLNQRFLTAINCVDKKVFAFDIITLFYFENTNTWFRKEFRLKSISSRLPIA